jgi:pyruvate/2-oxoglutarate dehydrogenase complex dihydrolipoamide acyltransferase (E2) component
MKAAEEEKTQVLGADDQQTLQEVERKLIKASSKPSPVMAKQFKSETAIMTPAVRHMLKELNLEVNNIQGTGRAGRVLKEDVHNTLLLCKLHSTLLRQLRQLPIMHEVQAERTKSSR